MASKNNCVLWPIGFAKWVNPLGPYFLNLMVCLHTKTKKAPTKVRKCFFVAGGGHDPSTSGL